tara:strand:- start:99 stop:1142 length:1044 start_codon:yes stop_codon:yes gene_type:complete
MTSTLISGDCLVEMKKLPDKSVDLVICDLPYGETNCKWDSKIHLEEFWEEFKRIRKSKRTGCIHFCSTKFGYDLIKSWEKGFKMDMVWKKRNKTGGLQSRYRPMRNHEMVYFFYEQVPKYNRDKYHKRINNQKIAKSETSAGTKSENFDNENKVRKQNNFNPVQPASVVEEKPKKKRNIRDSTRANEKKDIFGYNQDAAKPHQYEPPNPSSVVEEKESRYHKDYEKNGKRGMNKDEMYSKKCIKEFQEKNGIGFNPPNPASIVEEDEPVSMFESGKVFIGKRHHQTEKPQDILEFFLKYWSDEGDVILDPTMGSGSTGVACKKLKRNFIGIELDETIFKVAEKRINN